MIVFEATPLPGVLLVAPRTTTDPRGSFTKLFHAPSFAAHGLVTDYAEHYVSTTKRGVVRGMHFQRPPTDHAKLVACLTGASLDVVLDLRAASPTFGKVAAFELEGTVPHAVYIPQGFAHGFVALRDDTLMSYIVSTAYSPEHDTGILWNSIDFAWPFPDAPTSDRDKTFPALADFKTPF